MEDLPPWAWKALMAIGIIHGKIYNNKHKWYTVFTNVNWKLNKVSLYQQ